MRGSADAARVSGARAVKVEPDPAPAGPVLAIETSGRVGSVALAVGGAETATATLDGHPGHAEALIPAIRSVLAETDVAVDRIAAVVVGAGPGSFTGVRIAGAAAKALASSLEVPLYAPSSLRAAAAAGGPIVPDRRPEHRYVLFDARRGRVYGACYDVGAAGVREVSGPHGGSIVDVINGRPPVGTIFMGEGAALHEALLGGAGFNVRPPPAGIPTAGGLLACCDWIPVDPETWEPEYVREWKPG